MASEISSTMYENNNFKQYHPFIDFLRRVASRTRLRSVAGISNGLNDIARTNNLAGARHGHDPPRKK